ncbi:MAG: SPOR domain-containing protein [Acetobacteraceae bacterium]
MQVQLAALSSAADARIEWQRLQARMPAVLRGLAPDILKVQAGGKVFWRLRTGHFASIAAATGFCQAVVAAHGHCTIATW